MTAIDPGPAEEAGDVGPLDHTQLDVLRQLVDVGTPIAGDVVEISARTWAIHGSIPVDGEVILAEYATAEQARDALAMLALRPGRAGQGGATPR